ncbi:glycosyltransferase family 4 protein [Patescibacteria group bacterium]
MKIAIDASQILFGTGVSFYTSNLLKGLSAIDKKNEYIVFASSLRGNRVLKGLISSLSLTSNFKSKIYTLPPTYFETFWNRLHIGNIERFVGNIDVFHSSDWTQPPVKQAKIVTTIHDLAVFKYPKFFPSRIIANQKLKLKWVKKEADAIIAVSNSTKKDIVKYLDINAKKIHVIHEAVPIEHKLNATNDLILKLKKKYSLTNYILFVGTIEPRKNLKNVIKAFKEITNKYPKVKLVVVGKSGWKKNMSGLDTEKIEPKIKFLGNVDDKELALLYAGAKCFVYPSFYEGFGLPLLEAMNYGCPVITSKTSSLKEVAGKAALFANPKNHSEIAKNLKLVLNSKKIREKLVEEGKKQAAKFSWQKTAKQTLEVYKSLVSKKT